MAACVDNFRIRQYQVDKANMPKVIWHFVDEKRRAVTMNTRVVNVLFAESRELIVVKFAEEFRVLALTTLPSAPPQTLRQRKNIRQFQRAVNLGMGRQYLLEQCRPRSW